MKVKLTENVKKYITIAEMLMVRRIISDMKEDTGIKEYAQMAARIASGTNERFEILKSEASIAKNCRICDAYAEGSGNLDVWLEIYAFNQFAGFYEAGVYLTDLWKLTGENAKEIKAYMFINEYKAVR